MAERNVFKVGKEGDYITVSHQQKRFTREQALDLALSLLSAYGMTSHSIEVTEKTALLDTRVKR